MKKQPLKNLIMNPNLLCMTVTNGMVKNRFEKKSTYKNDRPGDDGTLRSV